MTLLELVTATRNMLDDKGGEGYDWETGDQSRLRWTNEELTTFLNEAEREVARRTHCLIEAVNSDICQINVVAGETMYPISPLIIKIKDADLLSSTTPLVDVSYKDIMRDDATWKTTQGLPLNYVKDYQSGYIKLYPIPVVDDTIDFVVYRLPLDNMEWDSRQFGEPEIPSDFHYGMIYWAGKLAYEKDEPNSLDIKLGGELEGKFMGLFGMAESLYAVERKKRTKRGVRYGGI